MQIQNGYKVLGVSDTQQAGQKCKKGNSRFYTVAPFMVWQRFFTSDLLNLFICFYDS